MRKPKRWCVWVRFKEDEKPWEDWILAATLENVSPWFTAHRQATYFIKEYWTCREQRRMLPEGRKPR